MQALFQTAVEDRAAYRAELIDPRRPRADRQRFFRDDIPELRYANSLYVPAGCRPARGWLLVRTQDYRNLSAYATDLQLQITDFVTGTLTFGGLVIVQARCVTRGLAGAADAVYLVEVTDARGVYSNPWFKHATGSQYNIRAPAYPGQFYADSVGLGGVPLSWDGMVQDLWEQMPLLGVYPGLPVTPSYTPEGWAFPGEGAWGALCRVLDQIGCYVACDLTSAAPYSIVYGGASDADFDARTLQYAALLEDDYEWIDAGSGRVPGSLVVYFHRRNEVYGTEETIRRDANQWSSTPFYTVSLPAPAGFDSSAGVADFWSDFTVRYDVDNAPLAADVVTANAVAASAVTDYFARIYRQTLGFMSRVYAGALPFKTGSRVDGVCWSQDFKDLRRQAWRTKIVRGPSPPWPEVVSRGLDE